MTTHYRRSGYQRRQRKLAAALPRNHEDATPAAVEAAKRLGLTTPHVHQFDDLDGADDQGRS